MDAAVAEVAQRIGIPQRLISATSDRMPAEIAHAVPCAAQLLAGEVPQRGFGLVGSTGAGKSAALAILSMGFVRARIIVSGPSMGSAIYDKTRSRISWVDWPNMTQYLRGADAEQRKSALAVMSRKKLLVLDDIGRERRVGATYADDFAASCIESIIAARERYIGLPILWTSNLDERNLSGMYGAATMSRLCGIAPPSAFLTLPDLRRG